MNMLRQTVTLATAVFLFIYFFLFSVSIGRRRFKPTEHLEESSDVSKVLNPNPHKDIKCMQYPFSETDSEIDGTEDCLVLHVYSPKVRKIYSATSGIRPPGIRHPPLSDHGSLNKVLHHPHLRTPFLRYWRRFHCIEKKMKIALNLY